MRILSAVLLLAVLPWLGAAETDDRLQARIDAAARAAANPVVAAAPRVTPAPPVGAISISNVTQVTAGSVPRFGRLELLVSFAALNPGNYYDTRTDTTNLGVDLQATFTSPSGTTWHIPGYYDGTDWRIRFAPDSNGAWTYAVRATDARGSNSWTGGAFTCSGTTGHGWVRVDGRWLRHTDGTAFCPVPHNTGWQGTIEQPALAELASDAPSGSAPRLLSFWLGQPWVSGGSRGIIEHSDNGIWVYNKACCDNIDAVVGRAETTGVYLMPSIWIHDQVRGPGHPWGAGNWDAQPYADIIDSDTSAPLLAKDFFNVTALSGQDTEQWIRQRNLCRYILARWGASPAIAGWVGMVELNGTSGWQSNRSKALAWTGALDGWFVANDPYRSANGRAVIASSITDSSGNYELDPGGVLSTRAFDSYAAQYGDQDIAGLIADQCLDLGVGEKPVLVTEFGGNIRASTSPAHPAANAIDHLHNGTWSSLIAGAAMPAMLWCDMGAFPLLEATPDGPKRQHLAHLAKFIGPQSWLADEAQEIASLDPAPRSDVRGLSRRIADRGMVWLQRSSGSAALDGASATVSAASGDYAVWWYDTWTGSETRTEAAGVTGSLALIVPPAVAGANPDVAVSWQRYPAMPSGLSTRVPAGEPAVLTLASSAPASRIMSLPARGRLWQTADGVTEGAEITRVPTDVSDPAHRVIYRAPAVLGPELFTFAAVDARLSREATASITVTNPPPGSSIVPVEYVYNGSGCGAGALAGLGLLGLLGLRRRR